MINKVLIFSIILLAFIIRFYKLGEVPLSLNWDETSNAYNAYSILKTGRDEYGKFFPLTNRSFDDYKPPAYMYSNILSVALFDLTPFAARMPSAFFGTVAIVLIYILTAALTGSKRTALISTFLLAVSTWHIQFSRIGFEANLGFFMTLAAFTAFAKATLSDTKTSKSLLIVSAFLFGISLYTYHSQRIFIPLMLTAAIVIFKKEFFSFPKKIIASFFALIFLLAIAMLIFLPQDALLGRFESVSQKARLEDIGKSIRFIEQDQSSAIDNAGLIHNRRIFVAITFLKNYLLHFDPNFLFVKGDDNPRFHTDNMGMLFLFQLPLLIVGLYLFVKERSKKMIFIVMWLLLSPIPAITGDAVPHALRSFTMLVPITIISAFTFVRVYSSVKTHRTIAILIAFLIFIFSFFSYFHNYYFHYPYDHSSDWQYGYREAVKTTEDLTNRFEKVYISSDIEQAYIFWLFNLKYDPHAYIREGTKEHIGKYYFKADSPTEPDIPYIAGNLDSSFSVIDTIYSPSGDKIIEIGVKDEKI